jgi:hypothetical protein
MEFVDVLAVECCRSIQNFNDKRSRYVPALHSYVVDIHRAWLQERTSARNTGRRWELAGLTSEPANDKKVPVRTLRVLFALPDDDYAKWSNDQVPAAYEYLMRHTSLVNYRSPKAQQFLTRMTLRSHFYTEQGA